MTKTLLRTKLFVPPLRASLVARPRLLERLDAGLSGKVTLIAAPAGFGKTTLVTDWLQQQERPVAWFSIEQRDQQPQRFFAYVLAALQTVQADFASDLALSLRSGSAADPHAIVDALLNQLIDLKHPTVLVLDDYHEIENPLVHDLLAYLIDYLPPQLHVIMTSRREPPLPLPRWRVRNQLNDIGIDALRFSAEEMRQFLQETIGLSLSSAAIANLETRTEGWVAALQLLSLSLQKSLNAEQHIDNFTGSHRQIADYLVQEVVAQQSPAIQRFLLQTAILGRFNSALCDALLQRHDSNATLQQLQRNNLFLIALDEEQGWYRYHHLFAELLRSRLQQQQRADEINALHRTAASWFAQQGLVDEAMAHAQKLPDRKLVAELLAGLPLAFIYKDGGALSVQQWGKLLSTDELRGNPTAAALVTSAALVCADIDRVHTLLALLEGETTTQPYQDLCRSVLVRNETGDHTTALELAQRAAQTSDDADGMLKTMAQLQSAIVYHNLGQFEASDQTLLALRQARYDDAMIDLNTRLQTIDMQVNNAYVVGEFDRALQLCQSGIELATEQGQIKSPLVGLMYAGLAQVAYERNQLDVAAEQIAKLEILGRRTGISDLFTRAMLLKARLASGKANKAQLDETLRDLFVYFDRVPTSRIRNLLDEAAAFYALRVGDRAKAMAWVDQCGLALKDEPSYGAFDRYHTFATILFDQMVTSGDQTELPALLVLTERLEQLMVASRHVMGVLAILTLRILVLNFAGAATAVETLRRAVELAAPRNALRVFLDHGAAFRPILRASGLASPFVERLLAAGEEGVDSAESISPTSLVQLTSRENDMLRLIADGLSNKEIEQTLVISKNTVRTHLKNLYGKLDVDSRTQAIKRARALGLL